MVMEAAMVAAENSGIKDKAKLREYLYKNPKKLAAKLAQMLQSKDGDLLHPVKLKGKGPGYYYSYNDKKLILCPRNSEYYLLPWVDEDDKRCYVYAHHNWQIGVILKVFKEDIEFIGFN
jgi:hypothetical protein